MPAPVTWPMKVGRVLCVAIGAVAALLGLIFMQTLRDPLGMGVLYVPVGFYFFYVFYRTCIGFSEAALSHVYIGGCVLLFVLFKHHFGGLTMLLWLGLVAFGYRPSTEFLKRLLFRTRQAD